MLPAPPRLERAWDIALALLVVANLGWTTWCLGGYRPDTMAVSAPLWLLTLALLWAGRAVVRSPGGWRPSLAWWPLPFLAYAAANVLWVSPVRWLGWLDWFYWLHLAVAFWLGLDLLRRPVGRAIVWGGVGVIALVAVGLAAYQRLVNPEWLPLGRLQAPQYLERSGGPFGIPNSFAALLVLLIPPAVATALRMDVTRRARVAAGVGAALGLMGLGLTISRGAWLSLAIAASIAPLLARNWSWSRRLKRMGIAVICAGALAAALYVSLPNVRARLDSLVEDGGERTRPIMWRISWRLFGEAPVWGTGAGSYRVLLERHRPEDFHDDPKWAHNEYLNTLSDYGLVGFGLSFGLAGVAAWWVMAGGHRRRGPPAGADRARASWRLTASRHGARPTREGAPAPRAESALALEVGLLAFGLSMLLDFHLKIPALVMVLGLYLAEWVVRVAPRSGTEPPPGGGWRIAAGAAAAGVVVLAVGWVRPRLAAEGERRDARQAIDRLAAVDDPATLEAGVEPAVAALRRALLRDPTNAQALSDLALALSQRAHYRPGEAARIGEDAERPARAALDSSEVVPEFWVHLGIALDLQGRWLEAGGCFTRALKQAPNHQLTWYYQAYHYSLNPTTLPLARSAVANCLRLDPGNPAAQSLQNRLRLRQ